MWLLATLSAGVLFIVRSLRSGKDSLKSTTDQSESTQDSQGETTARGFRAVLLLACLGVAIAQTIVVAVLPLFGRQLDVSAPSATWLLTAFMLAAGVVTPIAGRLGDLFGYRPVLLACLGCLAAGTALAALADRGGWFAGVLAGRVLQGVSAGAFPLAFGLARQLSPPSRLPGLIAALSAMFGVGGALGMAIAGPLAEVLGTAGLFWFLFAIAVLALLGARGLPRCRPADAGRGGLDVSGALLLAGCLVGLLLAVSQGRAWGWWSPATIGTLALAVLLAAVFVAVQKRAVRPVVDLALLRRPALLATNVATLTISIGMFAAVTVIPRFVQTPARAGYGFGADGAQTGLLMTPIAVFMVISAVLSSRLSARTSDRTTFQLGAVLACVALAALGAAHQQAWQFYLAGAVLGAAYGFAFAALGNLVVGAVLADQTGAATGINTILRTVGGAVGAQLAAVLVTAATPPGAAFPVETGYAVAFFASAGVVGAALIVMAAAGKALPR